ncbi:MAG TPA: MFS transporter [Fimbriimonadaceae bacterium]|nr:MFS transporter [Fimbriimonadaceae bacterium]
MSRLSDRLPALRSPGFRNYVLGSFVSNTGNTIQAWAIAWHVYHLTGSSLMVGLLGLVRVGPLLVFTLFGGVLADHADRRKIMIAMQSAMAVVALALFWTTSAGLITVGLLYLFVGCNAVARAFDGPARQSMVVGLVPIEHFPNAASLNGMSWRLSDVIGPIIAGFLLASPGLFGLEGLALCYGLNFFSFIAVLVAVWRLNPRQTMNPDRPQNIREVLARIGEGLRFVNRTPVVRSAMWIDFWATLFSGAEALLPAFAGAILKLGPQGYGILAASTGVGALLAATGMAWFPTARRQGRVVVGMIGLYGLATISFGLSQTLMTAAISLAAVGAADMISTVLRQTIRQLATPDELRGRMSATSSLFHISGPQLGDFEAGAVAGLWGERASIIIGGGLCVLVAAHWSRARALVEYEHGQS